jgi:hypothetical protein
MDHGRLPTSSGTGTPLFTSENSLDVIAGISLASVAYVVFLRNNPRDAIPECDRRLAPTFALVTIGIVGAGVTCFWLVYAFKGGS